VHVDEHTISLDDSPVYYRSAEAVTGATPLYLHGVPTSSDDWTEFLARTGGLAPDLIGFGRSGKGEHLDFSLDGLTDFVDDFLSQLDVDQIQIVGHDWGAAVALKFANRHPERVSRLVLCDAPPLLEGFAWPWFVRWWQIRGVGEMVMGATTRTVLTRALRQSCVDPAAWPKARIDAVWNQFDQGTQRAILRLVRSAQDNTIGGDEPRRNGGEETRPAETDWPLETDRPASIHGPGDTERRAEPEPAGAERARTNGHTAAAQTTLIWGEKDPWYPPALADAYATRLPGARVERVADAGHWPWLDRPEVVERVAALLER
jgi:pimeloyl-ACP methyl ester carboxylesterase